MTSADLVNRMISVRYELIDILAAQDGKITEHWNVVDRLDLYRQLGLVRANERQES